MSPDSCGPCRVGGQAVIEGVMIKGPRHAAVAVRTEKGDVTVTGRTVSPGGPRSKWPIIRGLMVFWQTLAIGLWALDISAKQAAGEEEDAPPWMMAATVALAFALGAALFFWLPLVVTQLAHRLLGGALASPLAFNLVDGVVRMLVFVLYLLAITLMPGIRRVFEYHGAEHKVVFAWEREGRFDVDAAAPYPTAHPRCGTAFLLTVMVVSIFFFSLIPSGQPFLLKFLWRLILLPAIAGVSYEVIRLAERPSARWLAWLLSPGLLLQRLTTREPDRAQLEVASAALGEVLRLEGREP